SAVLCQHSCAGDSRCQAWTWVKPGIQGPAAHCWLKSRVPELVKDSCCNSGSARNIQASTLRAENNVNRPFSDIGNVTTACWQPCQSACAGNGQCWSWSWVRPGAQGPAGRCWLKSGAPHPIADTNCISGVKLRPRSVIID